MFKKRNFDEKKCVNKCVNEYTLVEDLKNIHRSKSCETTSVAQIPKLINQRNVIIASGQVSILSDKFSEEQAFPYLLPMDKNLAIILLKIFQ